MLEIEEATFPEDAYTREIFLEYFRGGETVFAVAAQSGRVAGYVVAGFCMAESEVISIAVDPALQRSGVGAALMAYALRQLRARGVRHVELAVRVTNAAAVRLYRRFGFRKTGKMTRYYEDGAAAWRMARNLP